jgi:hypothetical protein
MAAQSGGQDGLHDLADYDALERPGQEPAEQESGPEPEPGDAGARQMDTDGAVADPAALAIAPVPAAVCGLDRGGTPTAEGDFGRPGPVAAVVRAVEDAAILRGLVTMVAEICSDESLRDNGPWEFSLDLGAIGLAGSSVDLRLSRELLELRFRCQDLGAVTLLSRHQASLLDTLRRCLRGPLQIEISMGTL